MKTAISIPNEVFNAAELAARELGLSRSELYTTAIRRFLEAQRSKRELLENLNRVYGELDSSLDPALEAVARETFARNEWE